VAQSGLWDVDGNGLSQIEDPSLASAFVEKVNDMNVETGIKAIIPAMIFAALPQSSSEPLVLCSISFALLYFVRDKIPTTEE